MWMPIIYETLLPHLPKHRPTLTVTEMMKRADFYHLAKNLYEDEKAIPFIMPYARSAEAREVVHIIVKTRDTFFLRGKKPDESKRWATNGCLSEALCEDKSLANTLFEITSVVARRHAAMEERVIAQTDAAFGAARRARQKGRATSFRFPEAIKVAEAKTSKKVERLLGIEEGKVYDEEIVDEEGKCWHVGGRYCSPIHALNDRVFDFSIKNCATARK